jgi:hypothetical protein
MRLRCVPSGLVPVLAMPGVSFQSLVVVVVAQPANWAWCERCVTDCPHGSPFLRSRACSGVPPGSCAAGVAQPASRAASVSVVPEWCVSDFG